jgi:uncharacterized protein (UPF0332 family)
VNDDVEPYMSKAQECLAGAHSELANGRYNNAANRAYYAAYNAAIVALIRAGAWNTRWTHDQVQAMFAGQLIGRRKLYPAAMRRVLSDLAVIRTRGDYGQRVVSRSVAEDATREAGDFSRRVAGVL